MYELALILSGLIVGLIGGIAIGVWVCGKQAPQRKLPNPLRAEFYSHIYPGAKQGRSDS